jgi:hypothetical protein
MAFWSNWSDGTKWLMGIVGALIVAAIIALAKQQPSDALPEPSPAPVDPTPTVTPIPTVVPAPTETPIDIAAPPPTDAPTTASAALASELTVAAQSKAGQRYPLHVRLAELSTTPISTRAKISLSNMSPSVLYYKIYYYHQLGGGIAAADRFTLVASDGVSQEWHEVDGVKEASPRTYFKNACLLLPPSTEVFVTFGYEKQSPPGQVVVVHTPVRLSRWAPCPGTEIELPEFTLTSALTP